MDNENKIFVIIHITVGAKALAANPDGCGHFVRFTHGTARNAG
jgi:hypothetical protein